MCWNFRYADSDPREEEQKVAASDPITDCLAWNVRAWEHVYKYLDDPDPLVRPAFIRRLAQQGERTNRAAQALLNRTLENIELGTKTNY